MKKLFADNIKNIHLIGIGGISMSALAKILHKNGYIVSGSDFQDGKEVQELLGMGMEITLGHRPENVQGKDLIIYTSAIHEDNPELMEARRLNLPIMTRGHFLGLLTSQFKDSIAISGTHGKTTTTSLVSVMLLKTALDPVLLVGAHVPELGSNAVIGGGEVIVNEACEYYSSFLDFHYNVAVILNIDEDHLDYFRDLEHIKDTFIAFGNKVGKDGVVILNKDDANCRAIQDKLLVKVLTYSQEEEADFTARDIRYDENGRALFDIYFQDQCIASVHLSIPGKHNISNTLAACAAVYQVNGSLHGVLEALTHFEGAARRMEKKGVYHEALLIEDYAHHPSEIKASLAALRLQYPTKRLIIAFQPHTYTRTLKLFERFSEAFEGCDQVWLVDIYAAREQDVYGIDSKKLAQAVDGKTHNATYVGSLDQLKDKLEELKSGDVFVAMGAGDIYKIYQKIDFIKS